MTTQNRLGEPNTIDAIGQAIDSCQTSKAAATATGISLASRVKEVLQAIVSQVGRLPWQQLFVITLFAERELKSGKSVQEIAADALNRIAAGEFSGLLAELFSE